jgi:hypothetical protein
VVADEEARVKTICVDFDGVIHSYTSGWQGATVVADPPVPGAIDWLRRMVAAGYEVCVYSSRSKEPLAIERMRDWIDAHGGKDISSKLKFPSEKPAAFLTIDDRCYRFEGDFPSPGWIERFRPWNKWGVP